MDTVLTYMLLGLSVVLITAGQVMQKVAVDRSGQAVAGRQRMIRLVFQPALWLAVLLLVIGMGAWLAVLYRMDVSKALPFVSLGQVLVLIASRVFFGEHISMVRWSGAVLIAIGITLVAQT